MLTFVAVLEPGGDIIFVNNTPLKIAGMNLEDIIGEKFYDTYWWEYSDEAKQTIKEDIELASSGKIISHPIQVKTTEGLIWIEFSIHPIYDDKKKVKYIVPEGRDITDSKQAEEERKVLRERLQRAEKMEALGTLAGGVAHDLNNVLGVLVGYSEILLQNVPQESPFQRHAMQIFKGSQRAAAIIQDLLTLTRRGVVVSETLNLNRVISDFLQTPEFEAIRSHHPGVQFKTSLDAELLNIKGSSTHLSKTVMNLLSNAAEAISGSGEVLIRTENRYVDRPIQGYDTTQEGEYAVLTVSDTGSGISQADLGRIFEPFYTKKVMGRSGTGLGLAVVWGTVKDHDGYIDVQSTEGEGSIFTLYFPVTREAPTEFEQAVPRDTYLGRGEHILIVDDVEGQRLLASAMLDSLGYKVSSVASGEEAIAFVKNKPVDLLILDMIMDPGMDGLDTYRSILDIRPRQKAIIVSGFSETDRVHAAQSLGAGAYIRKPYLMEKLGLAVRKELSRST
jgi:PAS domain S-box-containing protein